jgi:hypothetical protein
MTSLAAGFGLGVVGTYLYHFNNKSNFDTTYKAVVIVGSVTALGCAASSILVPALAAKVGYAGLAAIAATATYAAINTYNGKSVEAEKVTLAEKLYFPMKHSQTPFSFLTATVVNGICLPLSLASKVGAALFDKKESSEGARVLSSGSDSDEDLIGGVVLPSGGFTPPPAYHFHP